MADMFDAAKRSQVMAAVLSKGNRSTEVRFLKCLRAKAIKGWRRQYATTGKPDFAFPKRKVAVFLDGCFWHGCPWCRKMPSTNRLYWERKISRNGERDRNVDARLKRHGWAVLRFWEHELKKETIESAVKRLELTLRASTVQCNTLRKADSTK